MYKNDVHSLIECQPIVLMATFVYVFATFLYRIKRNIPKKCGTCVFAIFKTSHISEASFYCSWYLKENESSKFEKWKYWSVMNS